MPDAASSLLPSVPHTHIHRFRRLRAALELQVGWGALSRKLSQVLVSSGRGLVLHY